MTADGCLPLVSPNALTCDFPAAFSLVCSCVLLLLLLSYLAVFPFMAASRIACNAARRVPSAGRMLSSSAAARGTAAVLPDLTYDYGELEPAISGEIMKIHHTKHHQVH